MKYSARFIEFPAIIVYSVERDSEVDDDTFPLAGSILVESFVRLNPLQIESYSPDTDGGAPTGGGSLICTRVFMKSGISHIVNMPTEEFEGYLDECYSKLHG